MTWARADSLGILTAGVLLFPSYVASGFQPDLAAVRLPPSRAKRASASLAEAFGGGIRRTLQHCGMRCHSRNSEIGRRQELFQVAREGSFD